MEISEKLHNRFRDIGPVVLRIGIALVFLWFGMEQLISTQGWTNLIPKAITDITGLSASTIVYFNGAFEVVFGLCLLFGYFTRTVALFLAFHMLDIMVVVGYNAVGVRDFGLAIATIKIFLHGMDSCSIDAWLMRRKSSKNQ